MMDVADLCQAVLAGKVAAGARAIRWLDDGDPRGAVVLRSIYAATGGAHVVGITGPPGAGKSTISDMLVAELRRRDRRVGVIAIDPSSPFTGGAILGDRVRMARHTLDPDVFIRSIGTRGQAGGLARSTHDAALVLDAMGFDTILIETVGVGQDEIDVVNLAHTTVIVGVPGLGDEVQAVKAGLMEAGEVFVVNKADRDGFEATLRQFELMLHLREQSRPDDAWSAPLLRAVANRDEGGGEIVDALEAHLAFLKASDGFERRSLRREREQVLTLLRAQAIAEIMRGDRAAAILDDVTARRIDPYSAAKTLISGWRQYREDSSA